MMLKKSDCCSRVGRIYGVTAQSKIVISNGIGAVWFRHTITLTEGVRDEKVKTIKANDIPEQETVKWVPHLTLSAMGGFRTHISKGSERE